MTSTKLKHSAKLEAWAERVRDCRSSDKTVQAWCKENGINSSTYYRWEREVLKTAGEESQLSAPAVMFAELPTPKQTSRNVAECCATLRVREISLDIYSCCDKEQLKTLVELIQSC